MQRGNTRGLVIACIILVICCKYLQQKVSLSGQYIGHNYEYKHGSKHNHINKRVEETRKCVFNVSRAGTFIVLLIRQGSKYVVFE